ncbi:MAG: VacJ family lipoprotein [Candidatus Scalindua sediminis]|nr:VacJ family lipoprotein [Candidatus Scalindua sediminis]HDY68658.1 VacJ family lipoprotein [Candidatus Scalindua sp.]
MGRTVLLTFFFVLAICLYNTAVWADVGVESSPVSEGKTAETVSDEKGPAEDIINEDEELEDVDVELEKVFVKDPIRKYNRAIFTFNDKLYFYFMKPMYKGYNKVVPEKARLSVRKFFSNIRMPVRFFNCLFQGKFKGAGTEVLRLVINSTIGLGGLFDPAKSQFNLEKQDEDFGQTLGKHGMGSNYFIEWPFLGASNVRDTIGFVGDVALDPLTLLTFFVSPFATTGARGYNTFNEVSIDKGETYENIVEPAIDPYIALQDAYTQNRIKKIKE